MSLFCRVHRWAFHQRPRPLRKGRTRKLESPKEFRFATLEVKYKGHIFRSRLEARWAVAFDELGIRFWYEPMGYQLRSGVWYLPDFYISQVNMYAEVKPGPFSHGDRYRCAEVAFGTKRPILLLVGPPDFQAYEALNPCDIEGSPEVFPSTHILDIDYHKRQIFYDEHRFWSDPGDGFSKEEDFTEEYRMAVYASRAARFEDR